MKARTCEVKELIKVLRQAYWEKENLEVDDRWQSELMARIRGVRLVESVPRFYRHLSRPKTARCREIH